MSKFTEIEQTRRYFGLDRELALIDTAIQFRHSDNKDYWQGRVIKNRWLGVKDRLKGDDKLMFLLEYVPDYVNSWRNYRVRYFKEWLASH